jgi:hypothetical protein
MSTGSREWAKKSISNPLTKILKPFIFDSKITPLREGEQRADVRNSYNFSKKLITSMRN